MEKSWIIWIFLAVLAASTTADTGGYCKHEGGYEICGNSDMITSVNRVKYNPYLKLNVDDFSIIAPRTFRNLTLTSLQLLHPNWKSCIPKVIELTPESFDDLALEELSLECMKIAVKPHLFKNLQSLKKLLLNRVKLSGDPQEFFSDFPHLEKLTLRDLNTTRISPYIFSGINTELAELLIFDKISVIDPKSFGRFPHLNSLLVHGDRLEELRSDIFDGLDRLKFLDLARNSITVVRSRTFSKLPQLETLILRDNRISEIESEAFSGLNLSKLYLENNNLHSLPVGAFHDLRTLEILDLAFNKIGIVPHNVFQGCVGLRWLFLHHNGIDHIEPSVFSGLHLDLLNLRHNKLTILQPDIFSGLHVKIFLDLRFNDVIEIKPLAFRNLAAGDVSLCYHNNVTREERDSWGVDDSIHAMDFNDCSLPVP